ncbi:nucleoside/nucleotide kinase family protein [Labedella phragmitis]|uniref:Nucleoside/nucleotide kinase family protein n=1 Tax=Labedella phragmitis TaxID=2498849 RepID=A0A444PZA0_9MICO|nr:nucleoside/nucleotide kinase family protein [Labedella phragmitis]
MAGLDALVADIEARAEAAAGARIVVGIAGAPGSGKSTAAAAVIDRLGTEAALVPMDGFHLADEQLQALGRRDRKGAPDTFDAAGYVALLARCRAAGRDVVYAPRFVREIEESYAQAIAVPPSARVVLTEGNYLLLDVEPWNELDRVTDVRYHLDVDEDVRLERLIARHVAFGKSPEEARAWSLGPDEANARLIAASAHRADALLRL